MRLPKHCFLAGGPACPGGRRSLLEPRKMLAQSWAVAPIGKNSNCRPTPLASRSPMQPTMIRCVAPHSLAVFPIRATHFPERISRNASTQPETNRDRCWCCRQIIKHSQRIGVKNCNGDANTSISPLQTTRALPIEKTNSGFEVYNLGPTEKEQRAARPFFCI